MTKDESNAPKKYLSPYKASDTEEDIYSMWEKKGYFNPDICVKKGVANKDSETFSIVLPPPNETGILHIGHASMISIEDIMVRFNRMLGKRTLWIPGTDHAAIATNAKVEKALNKKGIKRHDIGREKFLKEVEKFTKDSRGTILKQVRRLGASVDWSRKAYTLDKERSEAVTTAFKKLYDLGLIYRGQRIVNWDPKAQTTISDDEIVRVEKNSPFYYLKYGPFTIATARPETKFGDKYVVMHPDDERYKDYEHGQKIELEWINGPITATVIKDDSIDPEFGTGVMTITPWHDNTDFEIAERHNLDKEQIIDKYGKLLPVAGEFEGMKIKEAREKIVEKLDNKGLLVKVEEKYTNQVATSERTGALIEPQIMKQWFIDVNKKFKFGDSKIEGIKSGQNVTLKEVMLHVVKNGNIDILPERFEKVYFHWIENLRDWNISRQIWFGHRIPVWYKDDKVHVGEEPPEKKGWEQDPDTLDTWFSSGLWTFSTLGWPEETDDLQNYHPNNVLETGYDILFFWVARMILMTTTLLGEIPFETVYLHGLVRDDKGRKISKSLGNNIDPVDMIDKFGADALRMSLIVGVGPGSDNNLGEEKIKAYKHFSNKVWNITRFVLENTDNEDLEKEPALREEDRNNLANLDALVEEVTKDIENYQLHLAAENLYHFIWHTFADEILEESKNILESDDESEKGSVKWTLRHILRTSIKLLHPFMPFLTEEIWKDIKLSDEHELVITKWPLLQKDDISI